MRASHTVLMIALFAAAVLSGCKETGTAQNGANGTDATNGTSYAGNTLNVPSGTSIGVSLGTGMSSESAGVGTDWNGTVVNGAEGIPVGSLVSGSVVSVKPAVKGDRAMLDLGLTSITVDGRRYDVHGSTEAIVAGSTRARNLGAIAGSAAAGAVIGKAVGHSTKGAVVGAVIGAGAATGVVSQSDGYQVVLKPGMALTFTTSEAVAVRQ